MKTKITVLSIGLLVTILCSFTQTDFTKTLVGKWELKTIETPGKPPMDTKPVLGESFIQFNIDFTYEEESGGRKSNGIWKITDNKYLQTKTEKQADFTEKVALKEIVPDKIEMQLVSKTKMVYQLVK